MKRQLVRVVWLCAVLTIASVAWGREWRDSTGKYSRTAEFVACRDGVVELKRAEGKSISIKLDKLSNADQKFIEELQQKDNSTDPFRDKLAPVQSKPTMNASSIQPASYATTAKPVSAPAPVQPAAMARQAPAQTEQEYSPPPPSKKLVYKTCRGTFELFGPSKLGTALFHLGSPSTFLDELKFKDRKPSGYYHYVTASLTPASDVTEWWFSIEPNCWYQCCDCCGCCHWYPGFRVYYKPVYNAQSAQSAQSTDAMFYYGCACRYSPPSP